MPSPVWLVLNWFSYGAIVMCLAFTSDEFVRELMRLLDLSSTPLALLTFLLITIVIQAAVWGLKVAARKRTFDPSN